MKNHAKKPPMVDGGFFICLIKWKITWF